MSSQNQQPNATPQSKPLNVLKGAADAAQINTSTDATPQVRLNSLQDAAKPEAAYLSAAKAALYNWAATIASRNVEDVVSLYAKDAILVPTFSNEVRECQDSRAAYFENFLSKEGLTCEILSENRRVSRSLGTVAIGGLYNFTFVEGGKTKTQPSRYLFTFEEINGEWLITAHHSSVMP